MKNKNCQSYSVRELLTKKVKFIVPRYQRRYSWSKNNVSVFLNDLFYGIQTESSKLSNKDYFIGIMIFNKTDDRKIPEELDIVDGQQRITTIILILSIISKKLKKIGNIKESKKTLNYIFFTKNRNSYRTLTNQTSEQYLFDILNVDYDEKLPDPESEEEIAIKKAYEKIEKILSESNINKKYINEKYSNILICLREQVLKCYVFAIIANNAIEANTYFETLNGKGVELLAVDLVKNRIFEVCGENPNDTVKNKWNKILAILYGDFNHMANLQTFYRHYWNSRYSKESEKTLFAKFKKFEKNEKLYLKFISDMEYDAKNYMKIVYPKTIDFKNKHCINLIRSLEAIDDFGVVIHRTPIMALLEAYDKKKIKLNKLTEIVHFLELFHFEYNALLKKANNIIETYYSAYAINVRKSKDYNEIKKHTNELFDKLVEKLPKRNEFIENFIKLEYEKNKKSLKVVKARYVVRKLSCIYEKSDVYANNGSVEHIVNERVGGIAINIGNLIYLEESINKEIEKIDLYDDKIEHYKESKYKWIKCFMKKNKRFDISMISERANILACKFYDYAEGVLKKRL